MGRFKDGLVESVTMGLAVFARDYLAPVWQPIHYLIWNNAIACHYTEHKHCKVCKQGVDHKILLC